MTQMEIQSPICGASNGYKVDVSKGQSIVSTAVRIQASGAE